MCRRNFTPASSAICDGVFNFAPELGELRNILLKSNNIIRYEKIMEYGLIRFEIKNSSYVKNIKSHYARNANICKN